MNKEKNVRTWSNIPTEFNDFPLVTNVNVFKSNECTHFEKVTSFGRQV